MATDFQILSFISGKGGSGKTAICLSTAFLLSKIGYKVVVVDLDLATHGASYFFRNKLQEGYLGLTEGLKQAPERRLPITKEYFVPVADNFWFVSSKTQLDIMSTPMDAFHNQEIQRRFKKTFDRIMNHSHHEIGAQFVLLDGQAGATQTVEFAVGCSDKAVIVLEPDNISCDAADALRFQFRDKLPHFKGLLLNKVDVEDAETYKRLSGTLGGLNHFPPLPFDRGMRDRLGRREIPVSLDEPSTFLFALVKTLQAMIPEVRDELRDLEDNKVNAMVSKYETGLREATERRQILEAQIEQLSNQLARQTTIGALGSLLAGVLAASLGIIFALFIALGTEISVGIVAAVILTVGGVAIAQYGMIARRVRERIAKLNSTRDRREKELSDTQDEIRRFESYVYARSREFMLDLGMWGEQDKFKAK